MTTRHAIPVRGFMLDISRDRVPTRESLGFLVRLLAACGYSQLELYMEHTFAHPGYEEVWGQASPLDADDMVWLDQFCRDHGLALVANRNCLGHMERWLKHPRHVHRAELASGFDRDGCHWGPSTLAITEDNLAFVHGLLEDVVTPTSAKAVNIGMDEPWEFGRGASRALVEREGRGKVYTDWVLAVAKPWLDKGYRVEIWSDILQEHPDQATRLPSTIDLVLWRYDSPEYMHRAPISKSAPPGTVEGFTEMIAPFAGRGPSLWVAPGTGTWNSVIGRLDCAIPNIIDAATAGAEADVSGFLLTAWGDNGHWEGYVHTLVPIIAGGFAAQHPDRAESLADPGVLTSLVGTVLWGNPDAKGAEFLVRTGMVVSLLDLPLFNSTVLWKALFEPEAQFAVSTELVAQARAEVGALRQLGAELGPAGWVDEMLTSLDLASVALDRLDQNPTSIPDSVLTRVQHHWLATSRPGGLSDSLARLGGSPTASGTPAHSGARHWGDMLASVLPT